MYVFQKTVLAVSLLASSATLMSNAFAQALPQQQRVWVSYKEGNRESVLQAINEGYLRGSTSDIEIHYDMQRNRAVVLTATAEEILQLASHPSVESVEEDHKRYQPLELPGNSTDTDTTAEDSQRVPYGIPMVQAEEAWHLGVTGQGVKVCVMDTGIDVNHEDFVTEHLDGTSAITELHDWDSDGNGHGTHVSGTIAAAHNDLGVVGVAPDAEIFTVKVFNDNGGWIYASDLVENAYRCLENGAYIINMSLGGPGSSEAESRGFEALHADGALLVAASGNSGSYEMSYPASYPEVVSVAAVDENGSLAYFSTYNEMVDIAAPGVNVLSTVPTPSNDLRSPYGIKSGTSMASPHVAGVAALLFSYMPSATVDMIEDALLMSTQDLGRSGKDIFHGHGLVQAVAAMEYLGGGSS